MKLIIPTIVFSVALTTPVSAGHSRHGYFDGSQSMDGRYTVSPRRIDTKDKNDRLTDYHWVYTWTDTKTGKTIEGKLQGIRSGSSNVFDPVNAHIFVAPDGETFAVWNPQSMAPGLRQAAWIQQLARCRRRQSLCSWLRLRPARPRCKDWQGAVADKTARRLCRKPADHVEVGGHRYQDAQ